MSDFIRGWTVFGKRYHIAWSYREGRFYPPQECSVSTFLDQTTDVYVKIADLTYRREPTGALVPKDLTPCARCFPEGDDAWLKVAS